MIYVALFGEVNTGKSSIIKTLVGSEISIAVIAGSTDAIDLYPLPRTKRQSQTIVLADVPGTNEVRAPELATLAREEALRAHVVALVVSGDLSRSAAIEWQWLKQFDKPMWLILNKIDQYSPNELAQLIDRLSTRIEVVIPVQANRAHEVWIVGTDGQPSPHLREVPGNVSALTARLQSLASSERDKLELARQSAVLSDLDLRLAGGEKAQRRQVGERLIGQFTKRAVLGAMAAVVPGSDLVVQSALGLGLTHQLCSLYGVSMTQIELDGLMHAIGGKLKGSIALIIAIVGNGLKAFPGLGTLGGGVLHAIAYGLLFDRVGRALQDSLEQTVDSAKTHLNHADLLQRLDRQLHDKTDLIRRAHELARVLKQN